MKPYILIQKPYKWYQYISWFQLVHQQVQE